MNQFLKCLLKKCYCAVVYYDGKAKGMQCEYCGRVIKENMNFEQSYKDMPKDKLDKPTPLWYYILVASLSGVLGGLLALAYVRFNQLIK